MDISKMISVQRYAHLFNDPEDADFLLEVPEEISDSEPLSLDVRESEEVGEFIVPEAGLGVGDLKICGSCVNEENNIPETPSEAMNQGCVDLSTKPREEIIVGEDALQGERMRRFYVHKIILKANCPSFLGVIKRTAEMGSEKNDENGVPVVCMKCYPADVVERFLKIIYGVGFNEECSAKNSNAKMEWDFQLAGGVMRMGHEYETNFVAEIAADHAFKMVSKENVMQLGECACLFEIVSLKNNVVDWLLRDGSYKSRLSNSIKTVDAEGWNSLEQRNPKIALEFYTAFVEKAYQGCDEMSCSKLAVHCTYHSQAFCEHCDEVCNSVYCERHFQECANIRCSIVGCCQPADKEDIRCGVHAIDVCDVKKCRDFRLSKCEYHHSKQQQYSKHG